MNALLKKIQQGAKKKRILGGIGEPATAAAATAAAAAPILVKVAEFLKKIGIDPKEVAEVGKNLLAKTVKNAVNKQLAKEQAVEEQQQQITNEFLEQTEDTGGSQTAGNKNMVPLLIGGAAAIYLLTRKK
jgi:predicted metalloprotease